KEQKRQDPNSFYPYYLVYIRDDGSVKYNYIHSKKILDHYKKLCSGNNTISDLIYDFYNETDKGKNMKKYSNLLEESITSIIGKKEEKGIASLFSKGGISIQKDALSNTEDFELISFLIIR
ncbi:MAG: helicase, partial [Tenericutes bacterium]|nr:helicase [Mycoplasmatota bacterium]